MFFVFVAVADVDIDVDVDVAFAVVVDDVAAVMFFVCGLLLMLMLSCFLFVVCCYC